MRIVRWQTEEGVRIGDLRGGDRVVDLGSEGTMSSLSIALQNDGSGREFALTDLKLLPPIVPGKIVAVGLNYRDHAEETGLKIPERPLLFAKFPSAVAGPRDDIRLLDETSQLDYEGELGVVIGRRATNVSVEFAHEFVLGYVVANDVSARDAQFADEQWVRGKSFDTFAPIGPALVTSDEIADPGCLNIVTCVNGEVRQRSNTKHLIFDVPTLVSYISRYISLEPGDLILTGTPGGVGLSFDPPRYLSAGDEVVVEIDGVGTLRNRVTSAGR